MMQIAGAALIGWGLAKWRDDNDAFPIVCVVAGVALVVVAWKWGA